MAYKELSKYFSDDYKRESVVFVCIGEREFRVSVKEDDGNTFASSFNTLEEAECYAENWVSRK